MIFNAKCQSFKILLTMLFLIGSTFVANCHAERTSVSPDSQSYYQKLIGVNGEVHLATAKKERERVEQAWSELKLFANQQTKAAQHAMIGLDIKSWRGRLNGLYASPVTQQQSAKVSDRSAISATAFVVKYAANMTSLQWWQTKNLVTGWIESGHQRVAQATFELDANLQSNLLLLQLVDSASSDIARMVSRLQISAVIQAMSIEKNFGSQNDDSRNADPSNVIRSDFSFQTISTSTDEAPTADPYWQYYSDCDFWGAQFEVDVE